VVEIVDRDLSAWNTRTQRPGFKELMAGVREDRFDAVVVYNIDRLVRNVLSGWSTLSELIKGDVKLVSCTQEIDTSSPQGKAIFTNWIAFAEEESRSKSRRIKRALADKAAKGEVHAGGRRLFGYRKIEGSMEPIDAEVAILREVRKQLLGGKSMRGMAAELNERGVTTTGGNLWSGRQLAQMLSSPSLAGLRGHRVARRDENNNELRDGHDEIIYDRELHTASWKDKAVFTTEEWQELLAVVHGRSRRYHHGGIAVQRHLLSGLAKCGECGRALGHRTQKYIRIDGPVSFGCYSCSKFPGRSGCGKIQIASDSLERYVVRHALDFVSRAKLRPSFGDDELVDELSNALDSDDENRRQLDRERFILRTKDEASYRPLYEELTEQIEAQRLQLAALMARREEREKALMPGDRDELQRYWDELGIDEQRAALRNILREVKVVSARVRGGNVFHGDQRVRLEFNWNAYLAAAEQFEATATPEQLTAAEEDYNRLNDAPISVETSN
jgi:DNA invertase Pin-like site-specific DNA recombinase